MRERLKIDLKPRKLRVESEPYVVFVGRTFVPVIDVFDVKSKREYFLIISAQSIASVFREWMNEADSKLIHTEFWINKESTEKFSKYEIELA